MEEDIPDGARPCSRVLLLDGDERILLLEAEYPDDGHRFWLAPGEGLSPDEDFESAARRELYEETGLDLQVGRWVWTRRHIYVWNGRRHDQYERYFLARTTNVHVAPVIQDKYVTGWKWWKLAEIQESDEEFTPRHLADLLTDILAGNFPDPFSDVGV